MDLFRQYWANTQRHLKQLTVSQRLLIGLLVVIMLGTIFFMVAFSARPDWVQLVAQPLSTTQIAKMRQHLEGVFPYEVQGDEILVPASKLYEIQGALAADRALPHDMTAAFDRLASQNTIFNTGRTNSRLWNYAREQVLGKIIGHFPYLHDATVLISRGNAQGLGTPAVPSSATVSVVTRSGRELSESQVLAIVATVQGAVSGLRRQDIHITDGQRAYEAPAGNMPMPTDLLAFKTALENDFRNKLLQQLSYLGDVKIAVNVVPNMAMRKIVSRTYNPKGVVSADTQDTSRTHKQTDMPPTGGQPGVQPNVSAVAGPSYPGGAMQRKSSTNDSKNTTSVRFDKQVLAETEAPGSTMKNVTASISIPRSYFVSIYRQRTGKAKAHPRTTDPAFASLITTIINRIQLQAMNTIGATTPQQVQVDWFDDAVPARAMYAGKSKVPHSGGGELAGMVSHYGKQALLAGLACGALGIMLMMARRGAPSTAGLDVDLSVFQNAGIPAGRSGGARSGGSGSSGRGTVNDPLIVGDDFIGEAGEGGTVLTGIELDDETLKSRKMVDEVSTMIRESPENAAALMKRWMTKGQ